MPITLEDIQRERARRQETPDIAPPAEPVSAPPEPQAAPAGITLADIQAERQRRQGPTTSIGPMAFGAAQGVTDIASMLGQGLAQNVSPVSMQALPKTDILRRAVDYGVSKLPETAQGYIKPILGQENPLQPDRTQQYAKSILNKVGVPSKDLEPDTAAEQFVQRVVREVTGTVVGLPAIRALSAGAAVMPLGKQLLQEAGMGLAQGVGAATAQQIAPGSLPAEIAGQLAPNVLSLTRALVKNIGTRLVPDPETLRTQVTNSLKETMADLPQAERHVQQAAELTGEIPGFQPTLAEATRDPGLLALQRSQRVADPKLASRLTQQRIENIDALTDTLDEMFHGGEPGQLRTALGQRVAKEEERLSSIAARAKAKATEVAESTQARATRAQARISERVKLAQNNIQRATASLADEGIDATRAQELASTRARALYEDARKTFKTESRRLYENVDPDNVVMGPVGPLYDQASALESRALAQFDQKDLPRSLQDFKHSLSARAVKPAQPAERVGILASQGVPDDQLELQQFIRRKGGLNLGQASDINTEFESLIRRKDAGTTGLFRTHGGLSLQQMADAAAESGFLFEGDTVELLDAVRESMKHGKTYSFRNTTALGDPIDAAYLAGAGNQADASLRDVTVTLNDLQRLRSHVLRESRQLVGPDTGNQRRLLTDFRQMIEGRMETLAREQGHPDVLDALTQANQFYRQNVPKFATGAGERILRQRNGVYRTSNARVIREFLKTPEDAAQFVDGIGSRDAALSAVEQYMDAELYLRAVNPETGRLKIPQARQFLQDRDPMLRMFPELQERYQDIAGLERKAQRVEDAASRLGQRALRRVDQSEELQDAMRYAEDAEAFAQTRKARLAKDPGQAILANTLDNGGLAQIMQRQDANTQLMRLADQVQDNPDAKTAIARGMWEEFLRREGTRTGRDAISDNPILADKSLQNFLTRYGSTLQHIYGAEHVANLRKVANGLQIARAADRPPLQMGSPTAELLQSQKGFAASTGSEILGAMPMIGAKFRLMRFVGRQALHYIADKREGAINQLTQEMLYDPDISKTFAMLKDPKNAKAAGARLKAHLIMLGAENRFDDADRDE